MTSVAVIAGRSRVTLTERNEAEVSAPTVVPAQYLTFEIEGQGLPGAVTLDGCSMPVLPVGTTRAFLMFDAAGSVGFHCLRIDGAEWYFATEDGKLKLSGILKILEFIQDEGLAWKGALFFADGSAIRHPKIDYAWLEKNMASILSVADAIAARPLRRARLVRRQQAPGAGRLYLRDTISLLRANARIHLEKDVLGVIAVDGLRYSPRVIVAGRAEHSFDVVGNRRMTGLLGLALGLAISLRAEARVSRAAQVRLEEMTEALRHMLSLFPFAQLRPRARMLPERPAAEEIADDRYRKAFDLYEELSKEMTWEAGVQVADRLAYVASADKIYQAFVAVAVARAFDAKQVSAALWPELATPVFTSDTYDIYYDTVPPKPAFLNWRDGSDRPADQQPDFTIIDRPGKRGILLDAKYRVEPNGRLPASGIHDAQVYLQSFERKSIVLFFPGKGPAITRIAAKGYTILEVSVGPFAELETYMRTEVRPAIEAAMEPFT